ncbi:putative inorganic carbon transporter subunit DabA, partial [Halorubrum pallidum]
MSIESTVRDSIDEAVTTVGSRWPIHSFVTANPLSGFEDRPFGEAVARAADLWGGRGYPSAETFAAALERGQIDPEILEGTLAEAGYEDDPERLLDRMADATADPTDA